VGIIEACGGLVGIIDWNLFSSKTISSKQDYDLDQNKVCLNNVSKSRSLMLWNPFLGKDRFLSR
jgi:hypothetical protein